MKTSKFIFLALIIIVLCSCKQEVKEINPVPLPESPPVMTVSESNQFYGEHTQEVMSNTVGRKLPPIMLIDTGGKQHLLPDLINNKSVILVSDAFCSFGAEGLTNDYPKALKKLSNEHPELNYDVICLLIKPNNDPEHPKYFERLKEEVKHHFPNYYIITEEQSSSINYLGGPTRYFVNHDAIVIDMGVGISVIEGRIYRVLLRNLKD